MKKLLLLSVCAIFFSASLFAQTSKKELKKEDRELTKEVKEKAVRNARRDARKMKKEGWKVNPGTLPLDKLTENAWKKQLQTDEKGDPRYITADGDAVAETKTAAELQAIEMGKLQLAGLIESNISALISGNIANAQLSTKDAASVTEIVASSKNLIATKLWYVNPFYKVYKNIGDNKVKVQVKLFYDTKQSLQIAKKVVRKELKDKLKLNEEKLEKLMGIN